MWKNKFKALSSTSKVFPPMTSVFWRNTLNSISDLNLRLSSPDGQDWRDLSSHIQKSTIQAYNEVALCVVNIMLFSWVAREELWVVAWSTLWRKWCGEWSYVATGEGVIVKSFTINQKSLSVEWKVCNSTAFMNGLWKRFFFFFCNFTIIIMGIGTFVRRLFFFPVPSWPV